MNASPATRPLLAAALVALAGCASFRSAPPARDPALLSDRPARLAGRPCVVDADPQTLPDAAALVDTRALAADVAGVLGGAPHPAGYVLLSMGYAPDGANVRRALIEHSVSQALADTVQKLVFAHRRSAAPREREWGVRMRIDLGEAEGLRFRVGRRELCAAHPRSRGQFNVASWRGIPLSDFSDPWRQEVVAGTLTVWVRVSLDELGRVTDAAIERGMIRRGMSEGVLLNYVRALTFDPAVEDGRPVRSETRVPIRLPA